MKHLLALLALVSTSQVAAQVPQEEPPYAQVGDWTVRSYGFACRLDSPADADGRDVTITQYKSGRAEFAIRLAEDDGTPATRSDFRLAFDDEVADFLPMHASSYKLLYTLGDPLAERFRRARAMELRRGQETVARFSLAGSYAALGKLNECVSDLSPTAANFQIPRPMMPPPPSLLPQIAEPDLEGPFEPNRPLKPLAPGRWIGPGDYPVQALREGIEGRVRVSLEVDPRGRVADCTILESSGSNVLDERTCLLLSRKARFDPPTDGEARLITGNYATAVRWTLP